MPTNRQEKKEKQNMASGDQQGRLIKFLDSLELDYTPVVRRTWRTSYANNGRETRCLRLLSPLRRSPRSRRSLHATRLAGPGRAHAVHHPAVWGGMRSVDGRGQK